MGRTIKVEIIHPFGVPRSTPQFQQCLYYSIISLLCVVLWTLLCILVHFCLDIELSVIRGESFYYLVVYVFRIVMYDCEIQVQRDADLIYPKGNLKRPSCQFVILTFQQLTIPTSKLIFNRPDINQSISVLYYILQSHCTTVSHYLQQNGL